MHARSSPVSHRFSYPVYFYGLDLSELDRLDREVLGFGHNRVRPVSIHDRDYLTPGPGSIREKLDALLSRAGFTARIDNVYLVTSARVLHYVFNPVSFFFCRDSGGELQCVVVQVNNTFKEMHLYLLTVPLPPRRPAQAHYRADKVFHVSPFFDRKGAYDFFFADMAGGELDIIIQHSEEDQVVFAARLTGSHRPLKRGTVLRELLTHPLAASLTMPRILWQAARLRFQRRLPVFHKPPPASPMTVRAAPPGPLARVGRRVAEAFLDRISRGRLTLVHPDGREAHFGSGDGRRTTLSVLDNAFFRRVLLRGGTGLGESFVRGEWTTQDLPGTLALLAENLEQLREEHNRLSALGRSFDYARHLLKPNTVPGSRRNVRSHYDLGNDFFALFLDPTMTYSCALYSSDGIGLEEAQQAKLRSIIEKAGIRPEHHVLEVGCGWGSFAIEAARATGCSVTGLTISREQLALARERVARAGLGDRITLELSDYRQVEGSYDRIVSIEMLEAVGHGNLGTWFKACDGVLRPGGRLVAQVITIPDERYGTYRRSSDWIRRHIFPGGHLPSLGALRRAAHRDTELEFEGVTSIGRHYVRTLREWSRNLDGNRDRAMELGFDATFLRKWQYYFAYCMAGFETGAVDDLQIVMQKAGGTGSA